MKVKRIYMLLLGGMVMCLLSSCASDEENRNGVIEGSLVQGQEHEEQKPEESTEPPQPTLKVSEEPPQPTPEAGEEASQSIPKGSGNQQGQKPEEPTEPPQPTPKASEGSSQPIQKENGSQQTTAPNDEGENLALSPEESYKDILLGKKDFMNSSEDGELLDMVNIGDIWKTFTVSEMPSAKVKQFAIVDMDGDGENEVVLWNYTGSIDEGFEVLRYQDGKVYGYHFWYRALYCLKEDGTFIGSGGVANTTIGRILFLEKGYTEEALYQSASKYNPEENFEIQYYANGEICSEEEFDEALKSQEEKADAMWYELTPENVELAFENRF